ncbi:MAG: lipoyl(octanoyl) transferase LipB [Deltaproteobacteria bacterium]|nr:lipoyl(octanoyl) transferase LipB [Deltaproteobacteria bacterium]
MKQNFPIQTSFLGEAPYREALEKMNSLRDERLANRIPDQLLFLEHPPVITMGRRRSHEDLKINPEELKRRGIEFVETDRGGRLTYHGPGQLVVYFIVDIETRKISIDKMVWAVEEGVKRLLAKYGISASRDKRNPGIWVGNSKIASIGLHVHRGVTTHGVALNVDCDLAPFGYIIPCGIAGAGVTNLAEITARKYSVDEVGGDLRRCYEDVFNQRRPRCSS